MSSNERPKSTTRGTSRRTGVNPIPINAIQDQDLRDTQYPDEEILLMEDDPYASNPPRPPSSAIRLNKPAPPVRRTSRDVNTETQQTRRPAPAYAPPRRGQKDAGLIPASARPARSTTTSHDTAGKERRNIHWLLYVGLGMVAALVLWAIGENALTWGTNEYNTLVYGYPRTFQTDAVVGHNDSPAHPSHFIATNLHGQAIIVEFPGGDPSKVIDYAGTDLTLMQSGGDLLPITLSFSDVNHDGKIDMIVHIASIENIVFYNNGAKFGAPNSNSSQPSSTPLPVSTP